MDVDQALDEEILNMSTDDIKLRCRLLDNECSYMKSGNGDILIDTGVMVN